MCKNMCKKFKKYSWRKLSNFDEMRLLEKRSSNTMNQGLYI